MEGNEGSSSLPFDLTKQEADMHHVNNPVLGLEKNVKRYLSAVKGFRQDSNRLLFTDGIAEVEVKVISNEIIRVRLAPGGVFLEEFSYALADTVHPVAVFSCKELEDCFRVETNSAACVINKKTFLISFDDTHGGIINEDRIPMHWEENIDYGGYYVYATKKCQDNESFFGLGDKSSDFNLIGKKYINWNTDAYSYQKNQDPLYRSIPFYIGINKGVSYGIFFDNTFKSHFDFAHQDQEDVSFWADGGEMQYYYIHGPHMMDVIKRYHMLTGTHQMPAKWTLGFHQCRWSYYPEEIVKKLAQNFRQRKIPCDAIYLDIDYMDGYRCFTWNKKYFPDPARMIKELENDGFKTVVIIDPGIRVDPNYSVYREGKQNNYFCRRCDDYFMEGHVWPGRCQFPDFTNPKVRDWWGNLFKELIDIGVAGVWNDMNEPAVFGSGTFPVDVRHNYDGFHGSHRKAHNIYGMQMVRATYEGLKKLQKNKRPFTITRAGFSGVQRYSSVWTGDNVATWEHLKMAIIQCQRLSISGISFCGSDIGGFSGQPDGELFTRWIQMGVFSPFMRAHSAGDTIEREPWSFGKEFEDINRKFIELRYKLLPYIYTTFWEHYRYYFPIIRPLVLHEQENVFTHTIQEIFTFGDKILVAPVSNQGVRLKNVYLPSGSWYDFWTYERLHGGREYQVAAPLNSIPIFVKAGSVIPESPVMQYVGEFEIEEMVFQIYFSEYEVNSIYFEDNDDSFAFEHNIYLEKKFVVIGDQKTMIITQSSVGLFNPHYNIYDLKIIGLPFIPQKVLIDGVEYQEILGFDDRKQFRIKCTKSFKRIEIIA
ncbi:TIM-barrel domain-containing protein [Daejeonella sp.]|jgi:alpha-glucosidase|uniref:glycoside hydrolase family 31 protein n=1 Tax=Daejeonella sp. TaxID=2805397 RepID=UPI003783D78D